ncbi:hypothetical protein ABIE00_005111 [Arthrobacter sp. OAP107]
MCLRPTWQAHTQLENQLAGANSFKDTARMLFATSFGVTWSVGRWARHRMI